MTSTDYVPALLEKGRARAAAEGLAVGFHEADAENLPFADGSFDVALSTFGAMSAPDHARTAGEMLRVVRSGGRIGLANWTPGGFTASSSMRSAVAGGAGGVSGGGGHQAG